MCVYPPAGMLDLTPINPQNIVNHNTHTYSMYFYKVLGAKTSSSLHRCHFKVHRTNMENSTLCSGYIVLYIHFFWEIFRRCFIVVVKWVRRCGCCLMLDDNATTHAHHDSELKIVVVCARGEKDLFLLHSFNIKYPQEWFIYLWQIVRDNSTFLSLVSLSPCFLVSSSGLNQENWEMKCSPKHKINLRDALLHMTV